MKGDFAMHIGILGTGFGKYHGELYKKIDPSIHLTFWGRNDSKLKKNTGRVKLRLHNRSR